MSHRTIFSTNRTSQLLEIKRTRRTLLYGVLIPLMFLICVTAKAHTSSDSYLKIDDRYNQLLGQWSVNLRDLNIILPVDHNADGEITWGELKEQEHLIRSEVFSHLAFFDASKNECTEVIDSMLVEKLSKGMFAVWPFQIHCPSEEKPVSLRYTLLSDIDPTHRNRLTLKTNRSTITELLKPQALRIPLSRPDGPAVDFNTHDPWSAFGNTFMEGVRHILSGLDHLLFVGTMLLVVVLQAGERKWVFEKRSRRIYTSGAKILTGFTIGHSLTLGASVIFAVSIPSRPVEILIALSIVVVALGNVRPSRLSNSGVVALGFGLIHGLGFAGILNDMGLRGLDAMPALFAFNLGVETGQFAMAMLVLPVLIALRDKRYYVPVIVTGGSAVISLIAGAMLVARV